MKVGFLAFFLLRAVLIVSLAEQTPSSDPVTVPGPLKIEPLKLDFGSQAVGMASPPMAATITNTSNSPIRIVDITASGIDFNESTSCGEQIQPGAECAVQVVFKPAITGNRFGVLSVVVSNPGTPYYLGLTGVGQ